MHFNPRSREGSDYLFMLMAVPHSQFQSTLPRRERPVPLETASSWLPFQSTLPRRERRCSDSFTLKQLFNFNPRSREGSDFHLHQKFPDSVRFQSTLPRRERLKPMQKARFYDNFNPRSREGSDFHLHQKFPDSVRFQSTLPRRERPISYFFSNRNLIISIHAPAKGATF